MEWRGNKYDWYLFLKYHFTLGLTSYLYTFWKVNYATTTVFCLLIREAKKRFINVESKPSLQ